MKHDSFVQNLLLIVCLLGGLGFAYIDSRSNWDDTGTLAFGMLIFSGAICLAGFRRPWLAALCIGIWIPLQGIVLSHNFGALLALAFSFAGAYAGWGLNKIIRRASK